MIYFVLSASALCAAIGHILLKIGAGNHANIISFLNGYIASGSAPLLPLPCLPLS